MGSSDNDTITDPAWLAVTLWTGGPIAGAGILWGLTRLAGWITSLEWFPFQGPFKLVASIPEPGLTLGSLGLGVLIGLGVALLAAADRPTFTVTPDAVVVHRGGREKGSFPRAEIGALYLDKRKLVLLDTNGGELARESSDIPAARLRELFTGNDLPWREADPHAGEYHLWVEDTPELSGRANALLKARRTALDKLETDEANAVRAELAKLGVVVRDEKKRQYWRQVAT
ncbi:hypothetical protein [Amycolatopsis suaedae]|uniref:DUF308 domain-containing protein n=1 Tax=Amycolatopsis suaedae TaxID=2510978 RepID=A0A4V2ELU2_9PSEU|nr:hypothetical protein [Amycolatopsis suaedae]RZQ62755.1 hypothetical protein EWH70_17550 [Amycolatopsis suaedae]